MTKIRHLRPHNNDPNQQVGKVLARANALFTTQNTSLSRVHFYSTVNWVKNCEHGSLWVKLGEYRWVNSCEC